MQNPKVGRQWQTLCKEFQDARSEAMDCFGVVNTKFRGVYEGTGPNPTNEELEAWDSANKKVEDVKRRMDAFVRANV